MTRVSPVTLLVGVAGTLIAAFVGSTIVAEHDAQRLDRRAADIVDNSAPSITELSAARTELRRLELGVGRYLSAHVAGETPAPARVEDWRAPVDAHLFAHAALASFGEEREISAALERAKWRVYEDVDRAVAAVDAGRLTEARAIKLGALDRDADEVDRLLAKLIAVNNDHASAAASEMAALRRRATRLALLLDALSVLLGALLLGLAVRAARLYQRALDERRRAAEERASELDRFASRVAHDLKAPLASVVLGTTVAAEYPSETSRALEKIHRASRLMSEMIDALLAVARVQAPATRGPATAVARVVDVLVDEVRPAAEAVGATVRVEPYPATAAVACGPGVLASVLSNLLQNAVKYIAEADGARVVTLRVVERGPVVRFEVDDTGPGVPEQLGEQVFERYVRGEHSTGLGLGLATVKRLVESTGGRLGVHSHPGKGSCFWVELPRATGSDRAAS